MTLAQIRERSQHLILTALAVENENKDLQNIANEIENDVNSLVPYEEYPYEYKAKIRTLFYNLKHNSELRNKVISKELSPRQLIMLKGEELEDSDQRSADNLFYLESLRWEHVPDRENIKPLPSPEERKNTWD